MEKKGGFTIWPKRIETTTTWISRLDAGIYIEIMVLILDGNSEHA